MNKNCDTCAYQTGRWKVCTNKRKKAEANQELLKEKEYCHDYIEKDVLFSNFKATRYMYDFFISEVIERANESAKKQEKEQAERDWLKLREKYTIDGKFSCLALMRAHLSIFGKVTNDSERIS
nr:MAG TPA: hypothetical protein [Caudoviricetes sp.]